MIKLFSRLEFVSETVIIMIPNKGGCLILKWLRSIVGSLLKK